MDVRTCRIRRVIRFRMKRIYSCRCIIKTQTERVYDVIKKSLLDSDSGSDDFEIAFYFCETGALDSNAPRNWGTCRKTDEIFMGRKREKHVP